MASPKFQSRHYEALSQVLRNHDIHSGSGTHEESLAINTLRDVIENLDNLFKDDNPAYNSSRFIQRCGWHPGAFQYHVKVDGGNGNGQE